jgi:hypothetical protein
MRAQRLKNACVDKPGSRSTTTGGEISSGGFQYPSPSRMAVLIPRQNSALT